MFNIFADFAFLIEVVFAGVALVLSAFGLVDALRYRPDAFTAAGKASKNVWLLVLGAAVALSFISIFPRINPFSLPWILAVVGAGVYAADVRPALRKVMGRGSSGDGPANRW